MDKVDEIFGGASNSTEAELKQMSEEVEIIDSAAVDASVNPSATPMQSLASYVMARFKENEDFRQRSGITDRLDYCLRANRCEFSQDQRAVIERTFGMEIAKRVFVPITSTKIRAARALLIDLANQSGDPLFRIEPSPSPTLPDEIAESAFSKVSAQISKLFESIQQQGIQELPASAMMEIQNLVKNLSEDSYDSISNQIESFAKIRADRMQKKVWDVMLEGGWKRAFEKYIDDICTYGTGVIIGPVVKNVAKNECHTDKKTGVVKYRRTIKEIPCYEAVTPHDCYPAPDAKDVGDGPFCIIVKYVGDELWRMASSSSSPIGDGWISEAVKLIVSRHPRGGIKVNVRNYDPDRRFCENNGFEDTNDCTFEGVRCFSSVRGSELLEMGISKSRGKKIEADGFYGTETIVIDNRVVYCRIYPSEMEIPVSKGVFYTLPGSWWGESIAEKVAMCQTVLNNCIKAMLQNMAVSSGAIFWINDVQRMANKSPDALKLKAGMTIPFMTSMTGNSGAPIGAVNIPSTANELLSVWSNMQTQADADSGIPRYAEGQSSGQSGALRTSGGLAQFTEHMMRGMKMVMTTTDGCVITPVARKTADWLLLNDDDMSLKGDVDIIPVGLVGKVMKVQRDQSRLQLLQLVLNSQILTQAIGIKGIISMFRPSLVDTDINPDDVVPSKTRMDTMEAIEGIKQIFEATQASQGIQQVDAESQGGAPGIPQPETPSPIQGGVAERRSMA